MGQIRWVHVRPDGTEGHPRTCSFWTALMSAGRVGVGGSNSVPALRINLPSKGQLAYLMTASSSDILRALDFSLWRSCVALQGPDLDMAAREAGEEISVEAGRTASGGEADLPPTLTLSREMDVCVGGEEKVERKMEKSSNGKCSFCFCF